MLHRPSLATFSISSTPDVAVQAAMIGSNTPALHPVEEVRLSPPAASLEGLSRTLPPYSEPVLRARSPEAFRDQQPQQQQQQQQTNGCGCTAVGDGLSSNSLSFGASPPSRMSSATSQHFSPPSATLPGAATASGRWLRLRLLSPTTEMDIGAATYESVYPRGLSVEYLLSVAMAIYLCAYAFFTLRAFCAKHIDRYVGDLMAPYEFLRSYNGVGYDDGVDKQWVGFVQQCPVLLKLAMFMGAVTLCCRHLASTDERVGDVPATDPGANSSTTKHRRLVVRLPYTFASFAKQLARAVAGQSWSLPTFYAIVGVVFVAIVHGPHFFLPLLIIAANYVVFTRLQRWCPYWLFMAIMWTTHVALLYIIEINEGFELTYWMQYYLPTSVDNALSIVGFPQQPMWDQYMRWYVAYRMTTLRLIAFNYDLREATHAAARARERAAERHDTACVECAQLRERNNVAAALLAEASRCYKYRTEYTRDLADYSFVNYVAYVLFPPLYIAGPMSSFNAFVSHMRVPSTAMPLRAMARYAFGIARLYVTECILMHFVHLSALGKNTHLLLRMSVLEQAHFLLFMLAYLWIKFSFIWKSSRLFAMLSGIEVPEDMRRCFANTLTVRDFWRDWHASFNLWIVRYMYIPMGGRGRVALSVLPIFLFIAVWHDPALHLIKWALCIAVMFVAEMAVSACFGRAVAVFRREAAPAAGLHGDEAVVVSAGADAAACRAPRRGVVARLARVAARCLSPRVRSWLYRQIRVVAGMSTVFGLIVANLVGFSMQNAAATMAKRGTTLEPTDAEDVIARAFRKFTPWFTCGLVAIIYAGSALAVMDRDMAHHQEVWLKRFYGLKV
ncbi:glycerol uptake protein [Novymonas esmeraldas]|uniref:Glycerol uptake protein n=1 Tax=Novymonas esmeraldas TaxID=1808958 RepID=A0AAW0EZI5_9TRYP